MEEARALLLQEAQHQREARGEAAAAGEPMPADEVALPGGPAVPLSDAERILARAYNIGYNLNNSGPPAVAGPPAVRQPRNRANHRMGYAPCLSRSLWANCP